MLLSPALSPAYRPRSRAINRPRAGQAGICGVIRPPLGACQSREARDLFVATASGPLTISRACQSREARDLFVATAPLILCCVKHGQAYCS